VIIDRDLEYESTRAMRWRGWHHSVEDFENKLVRP
jgi:hypothetical protein